MSASVITVPAFASAHDGVRHFFGTRHQASMAYETGVPVPASSVEDRAWTLTVKQVHGTDALIVDRPVREADRFEGGWDALITDQPGVTVVVRTADCVPILVYDRLRKAVAAVHAGWRGALAGIVPKTIELMVTRFGIQATDLRVSIGPSAGPCCYEVDAAVLEPLRRAREDWASLLREHHAGKPRLDLRTLVRRQVAEIGMPEKQITIVNVCTICHPALFYSYRREGRVNGTMLNGITLVSRR
ncbi:MAG TPA: peptidoglycan editing factor PgeF [Nitrospira sp.]|nr:peptidoglycan editing factor PgeF [Nitrospira sp.]